MMSEALGQALWHQATVAAVALAPTARAKRDQHRRHPELLRHEDRAYPARCAGHHFHQPGGKGEMSRVLTSSAIAIIGLAFIAGAATLFFFGEIHHQPAVQVGSDAAAHR